MDAAFVLCTLQDTEMDMLCQASGDLDLLTTGSVHTTG